MLDFEVEEEVDVEEDEEEEEEEEEEDYSTYIIANLPPLWHHGLPWPVAWPDVGSIIICE